MAASASPLLLGFLGELVLWSNFQSVANLVKIALANWGPLSVWSTSGMRCPVKSSFRDSDGLGSIALRCKDSSDNGHLGVVVCDN